VKEPAQITNPEYSVDRIVARLKEAATRQGQIPDGASTDIVASAEFRQARRGSVGFAEIDIEPIKLQPSFHPNAEGHYQVGDLLKYHDRPFIQNAYRAILKRGPDAVGYKAFLESLRSAKLNKIDILARLSNSAEGRAKQVEIDGLKVPALIRRAYRVPVAGYLLNLAVALCRLPLMIRSQQQFEAHVLAQQEIVVEHLNHVGRVLRAHSGEVAQSLDGQSESIKQLGIQLQQQVDQSRELIDLVQQRSERDAARLTEFIEETQRQHAEISGQLAAQTENTMAVLGEFRRLAEQRNDEFNRRLGDEAGRRERELWAMGKQIGEATSRWQESQDALQLSLQRWREQLETTETQLRQADVNQREQIEFTARDFKREVERVFLKEQQVTVELALQGERVTTLLEEARKRLPDPFDEEQLRSIANEGEHQLDGLYASFDEQFRGSREEIKQRLQVYLPILRQRGIGSEAMPLLDAGCGRGEWLELLRDEHLHAIGVDANRVLTEWCRKLGLTVVEDDLLAYLRQQPDSSLGAVTGFHIIEHLPIEGLVTFLNQSLRVLKPGGLVIFETPNPQNVLVGSCNFYFDPTHRNPLPSQVTRFLLESRGFVGVEVLNLNPSDDTPVEENSELARRFNNYFYGPMDYAVIGWKV
jgi:SAM-dependent methyltransferase